MDEKFSILVVEDEDVIREIFSETFSTWEFTVDQAVNGLEALQKTETTNYDIIVTDLNMPQMNGIELIKKLKDKNYPAEIIVITGFATIDNAIEAMKAGAFDFITKPVNFDHVQFLINKCRQKIKADQENEELKTLNEKLKQLNTMKDKFLSITNHELRTPVTIIKGYIDILEMYATESEEKDFKEIVDILKFSTNELIDRLENIHILSQMEKRNLPLQFSEGNIINSLAQTLHEVFFLFKRRNIQLKVKEFPKKVVVFADFYRMKQVFRELLQNALKFTPDGGKVVVSCIISGQKGLIAIEDSGVGIPLEQQKVIFEPFYEVQDTIHHKSSNDEFMGGGMGLGLSFVREIMIAHEGSIEVESSPGKGSKFLVTIPLSNHPDIELKKKRYREEVVSRSMPAS